MSTLLKLLLYLAQGTIVYFTTGSVLPILALLVLTWLISEVTDYQAWKATKTAMNKITKD